MPTALMAYADGQIAVGELIAEVSDEHRLVGVPAVCLAQARATVTGDFGVARLMLLSTITTVTVLPLSADATGRVDPVWQVGEFARAADGDLAVAHAVRAVLEHEAYYATAQPKQARHILPTGWGILDISA